MSASWLLATRDAEETAPIQSSCIYDVLSRLGGLLPPSKYDRMGVKPTDTTKQGQHLPDNSPLQPVHPCRSVGFEGLDLGGLDAVYSKRQQLANKEA